MERKKRLTNGNKKVEALLFSMAPIKSCLNCSDCAKTCYATKAYKQYPSVKALWDANLELARNDLWALYDDLRAQLSKTKKRIVRIHQSGDFISQAYLDMWVTLAKEFTDITFYGYTKVDHLFDFSGFDALPNTNMIRSMINGKVNFGDMDYITELAAETGAEICPATIGQNVRCGVDCFKCMVPSTSVVFLQH